MFCFFPFFHEYFSWPVPPHALLYKLLKSQRIEEIRHFPRIPHVKKPEIEENLMIPDTDSFTVDTANCVAVIPDLNYSFWHMATLPCCPILDPQEIIAAR